MSEKLKNSIVLNSNFELNPKTRVMFRFFLLFFKLILTLPLGILNEVISSILVLVIKISVDL